jgi:streptomycin 3"-adenylyltransferase
MNTNEYLSQLSLKLQEKIGSNLIGLYLIGSACLGDYHASKSDLDIVGVLFDPLSNSQKNDLAKNLDSRFFPCPAKGLDLVLFAENAVKHITPKPSFEFWFSTGAGWPNERWESDCCKEMLIFLELCRQHGITLYGQDPNQIFATVDKRLLVETFLEMLEWHQTKILDVVHDPKGQHSILNACRILAFIHEDRLLSKSDGGRWLLYREADNDIVRKALEIREENHDLDISKKEIARFLMNVIIKVKQFLSLR